MDTKNTLGSSVIRKVVMSLTGLLLTGFLISHLAGNLLLLLPGGEAFNTYAFNLESLGVGLIIAELGLIFIAALHILTAIGLKHQASAARPQGYRMVQSKGGPSLNTPASRNMIFTGIILLGFIILHVWQFKFGAGVEAGYVTDVNGEQARDLHRLVVETFSNPLYVFLYIAVMVVLGLHLRHGVWSAFQSLGLLNDKRAGKLQKFALVFTLLLAGGFILIPLWIFCNLGQMFF